MYNRLGTILACDGRTDGWTDKRTDLLPRHSPRYVYASRGNNAFGLMCSCALLISTDHGIIYYPSYVCDEYVVSSFFFCMSGYWFLFLIYWSVCLIIWITESWRIHSNVATVMSMYWPYDSYIERQTQQLSYHTRAWSLILIPCSRRTKHVDTLIVDRRQQQQQQQQQSSYTVGKMFKLLTISYGYSSQCIIIQLSSKWLMCLYIIN